MSKSKKHNLSDDKYKVIIKNYRDDCDELVKISILENGEENISIISSTKSIAELLLAKTELDENLNLSENVAVAFTK